MFLLFPLFFFPPSVFMSFIFVGLMMVPDSRTESSPIKFIHKAVITFLSKVVLRLLNQDQKLQFRKLEAISKKKKNSVNLKLISNPLKGKDP